jgi:hypothetical protein
MFLVSKQTFKSFCAYFSYTFALLLIFPVWSHAQPLYRWVDSQGRVHYSDQLPPEAVPSAHSKIDKQGIVTEQVERAKTAEELAAERAAAKLKAEQERQDKLLLSKYKSLQDIIDAKNSRLKMLDARIDYFLIKEAEIQRDSEATLAEIRRYSQQNRAVPAALSQRMDVIWQQHDEYKKSLNVLRQERQEAIEKFDAEIKRFRELKP